MTQNADSDRALPEDATSSLGARLRAVRETRGLSLAKAAEDTGVSRSFLSLVERGESDISFGRLHRLINYYGIHIGDLVPPGPAEIEGYVAAGTETLLHSPDEGIELHLLAPDTERALAPFLCIFAAGAHTTDWEGHDGEEFVHVAEGTIEIGFHERETLTMRRGDSLMFGGREVSGMRNPTNRETRLFVAICPPIF